MDMVKPMKKDQDSHPGQAAPKREAGGKEGSTKE
jgi:hypothetical protein